MKKQEKIVTTIQVEFLSSDFMHAVAIFNVGGQLSCYNAVVPEDRKQYRIDEQ